VQRLLPSERHEFEDGKISDMTKIWNAGFAMKDLGWAE
jgi:hypothetical protein